MVDFTDPLTAGFGSWFHRRHIEVHEREFYLDAPRASLDPDGIREATDGVDGPPPASRCAKVGL
jgi:hypothetical protein